MEDQEYSFQKDKNYFLNCVGIAPRDFARLSEAVILKRLFLNTSGVIRNLQDYGFFYKEIRIDDKHWICEVARDSKGKRKYTPRKKANAKSK